MVTPEIHSSAGGDRGPQELRDWRRVLQLALAAIWLLDGILQLQPFFFTPGRNGFGGMLERAANGNPHWVAQSITWNASIVEHHVGLTNAVFAGTQILIGLGIAWRPTVRPALAASVAWSLLVWWFGEGMGGVLAGAGSPVGGGPGAVLFYGLLAVLLWPAERAGSRPPFAAARAVGTVPAKVAWVAVWVGLAVLMISEGRSPQGVHDTIAGLRPGEPSWLASLDRTTAALVSHEGLAVAMALTIVFVVVAGAVLLPERAARAVLVLAIVAGGAIWVLGQNFGMILPGGATDPNSGPLVILLALAYWPTSARRAPAPAAVAITWTREPSAVGVS